MWEPAMRERWDRAGLIASILVNAHKKKGGRTVKPEDFNPFRKQKSSGGRKIKIGKDNWKDLKLLTVRKKKPDGEKIEDIKESEGDAPREAMGDPHRDAFQSTQRRGPLRSGLSGEH